MLFIVCIVLHIDIDCILAQKLSDIIVARKGAKNAWKEPNPKNWAGDIEIIVKVHFQQLFGYSIILLTL